jgi:uncharacterized protein YbjT (DUF2867 family)
MIVVVGGSGQLGRDVVGRLIARRLPVRVVTRDPARARDLLGADAKSVEVVKGDVRDPASLVAAVRGATLVVSAIQGFGGHDAAGIRAIDRDGNRALIAASATAGVDRFVLLSIHGASPTDSFALARAKADAESALRASGLSWTIIRPTAYMETWATIVGGPILATGRTRVFGGGQNPINFVSAADVAAVVERVVVDPSLTGRTLDISGPENLTFDALVGRFAAALGRPVGIAHVPRPVLRAMSIALRPIRPVLAEQIAGAIVLDTTNRAVVDPAARPLPDLPITRFDTVIATMIADAGGRTATAAP